MNPLSAILSDALTEMELFSNSDSLSHTNTASEKLVSKESKIVPGTGAYNINKTGNNKFYIDKDVPRFGNSDDGKKEQAISSESIQ